MDFSGRHVVITGASSGIGRATAERIAAAGGTVTLVARREAELRGICEAIGATARWQVADVADRDALTAALTRSEAEGGPIDALFLNAGYEGQFSALADYDPDTFDMVMRVNATSLFWAIRHVLPGMMARGRGSILVTGSLAAATGMAGNIGYLASKHAAAGIAMATAAEGAAAGVRCNLINPGFIDTPMLAEVPEAVRSAMAGRVPQQRIGSVDEAAAVAAFLLSDDASHVTAQKLAVDGGLLGTMTI